MKASNPLVPERLLDDLKLDLEKEIFAHMYALLIGDLNQTVGFILILPR